MCCNLFRHFRIDWHLLIFMSGFCFLLLVTIKRCKKSPLYTNSYFLVLLIMEHRCMEIWLLVWKMYVFFTLVSFQIAFQKKKAVTFAGPLTIHEYPLPWIPPTIGVRALHNFCKTVQYEVITSLLPDCTFPWLLVSLIIFVCVLGLLEFTVL